MNRICLTLMICLGALACVPLSGTNPTSANRKGAASVDQFTIQPLTVAAASPAVGAIDRLRGGPFSEIAAARPSAPQPGVDITYIANEGVLLASGDKQVLIDGLHRNDRTFSPYAFLPPATREKIETAKAPFEKIDLLLFSHRHYDHFHAEAAGLHLQHNPNTALVSSQQVVSDIEQQFKNYAAIKSRVRSATPPLKGRMGMKVAGIEFELLGVGHGSGSFREIQNLGHIIKLGGRKLLHVGDAELEAEIFAGLNLDEEDIDIAILPFWLLIGKEGPALVREHIRPRHIIAVHVETLKTAKIASQVREAFPDAVIFTTMLEKRRY